MKNASPSAPLGRDLRLELERLDALRSYQVPETDSEQVFTDLAQLAAFVCGTPIAALSLIDGERQWFKARVGLEVAHAPREQAFCQYALHNPGEVHVVPDATQDPLFAHDPLVTADPHIRFYAGAPLLTPDGLVLGALCAFDTVPRQLGNDQRTALTLLARQVMAHLELRRTGLRLDDERHKMEGLLRMANRPGDALSQSSRNEIFVKQDQRFVRVATADLQYVEALGDYVNLHTSRERLTVYGTMKDLEAKLPAHDFARIHRKYIVRLDRIAAIEADVVLLDGRRDAAAGPAPVRVPIGSSYKAGLLGRLNLI